ncbi:phthiocerol/phthiodiolone dimycocerosyl transferase family protein [Nocardia vulneris]|uniref:Phthiocerol/phthiodiolone dimycocerosyl transferase n=1 Tax=Nocardia vulneris TaxID=1141657 RepID=A0ABR4ZL94_9NOCA|nr:hypothetical protein [Nocardia vulneris]KIA66061.1 hypothetical protein FG87_04450 [Nocardia vulneris]
MTIEPLVRPRVRDLDRSERLFAAGGLCVGYSVRVRGRLDLGNLYEAFAILRKTHPLLSCRIVDLDGERTVFRAVDEEPLIVVEHGLRNDEPLPDIENRTAALHVQCEDSATAWVTLLVHHSIADGGHAMRLLADLWTFFTDPVLGHAARPRQYPRSLEQLLAERDIAASPAPAPPVSPAEGLVALDPVPSREAHPRVELTTAETKTLVRMSHRAGVTINGLVSAVLLRAVADVNNADVSDVRYSYPVDLRRRLTPRVSAIEGTNVIGNAFFTPLPGMTTGALARSITGKLAIDLAAGGLHRHYLNTSEYLDALDRAFSHRPGTVLATNWGVIPELPAPDGIIFEDFRPVWHVTRPVGVSDIRSLSPAHMGVILTFEGRLIIEIAKSDPRPDALTTRLREHFDTLLTAAPSTFPEMT